MVFAVGHVRGKGRGQRSSLFFFFSLLGVLQPCALPAERTERNALVCDQACVSLASPGIGGPVGRAQGRGFGVRQMVVPVSALDRPVPGVERVLLVHVKLRVLPRRRTTVKRSRMAATCEADPEDARVDRAEEASGGGASGVIATAAPTTLPGGVALRRASGCAELVAQGGATRKCGGDDLRFTR